MAKKTVPTSSTIETNVSKYSALEEQLAQREAELAIINSIQTALASKLDFQGIINAVGDKLGEIFEDGNVGIAFVDQVRNIVSFPYVVENGKRLETFELTLDGSSLMRHVLKRRRPLVINTKFSERFDGTGAFNFPGKDQRDLKSWVSVPIFNGDEIIGGISLRSWEKENAYTDSDVRLLQTVANSMSVALENARLLKETEQRATELQIINNIGQTLTEGLDLDSTLERVGERLREALNIKNLGIVVFDPQTGLAISNYFYHYGRRFTPQFSMSNYKLSMRFASRVGYKPWVVNTNVERYWKKFGTDILTNWTEIPKAYVMVPLLAGGELVGSISIGDYENENAFVNLPLNLLETIASNIGTAIQNVRLFDETQRLLKETEQRANELAIINSVQAGLVVQMDLQAIYNLVGEKIRNLFDAQTVDIAIYDPIENFMYFRYTIERGEYFPIEPRPLMGFRKHVIESRQYLLINDLTREERDKYGQPAPLGGEAARSVLFVPMVVGEEVKGVISLQNLDRTNAFSDADIRLLQTFANSMTVALENARLFDETQRLLKETEQRATELQIINNIGQTITGELDLNTLIEHVGDKLRETFNLKSIRIAVADTNTGLLISLYMYRNGKRVAFDESWQSKSDRYRSIMRASARGGGRSWVVNTNAEKGWRKFALVIDEEDIPKSFVMLPLLAGREVIGGIYIPNYEKENAFTDFSIGMLETIASNMGTAIQNVRLFDETKKLFKEAEEARAAAEQANKAKSTFLANMSHELRTPLNSIMGFTQIVRAKAEGILPEKQIANLDKVLISSEHLLGLINTVLDLAKIEAGRMDVIPAKFNISALADQCGNLATPLLKPNVTLEKQVDGGIIYSDQDKIKQIVLNLLSNAAKFTHEGRILLSVEECDEENLNISVTDSGIGISEDALSRVFEEFQQADATTTRQYGGTGLGLAISRTLARLLGGDLTATSKLGKGSTFTLTIPIQYRREAALAETIQL